MIIASIPLWILSAFFGFLGVASMAASFSNYLATLIGAAGGLSLSALFGFTASKIAGGQ